MNIRKINEFIVEYEYMTYLIRFLYRICEGNWKKILPDYFEFNFLSLKWSKKKLCEGTNGA